jgi:hypothetical protein
MAHYETATQTWERGYKVWQRKLLALAAPIFLLFALSLPISQSPAALPDPAFLQTVSRSGTDIPNLAVGFRFPPWRA